MAQVCEESRDLGYEADDPRYIEGLSNKEFLRKWNGFYSKIHYWAETNVPKPIDCKCQICGEIKPLQASNKRHEYRRVINDWQWICAKCHTIFDMKFNDKKMGGNQIGSWGCGCIPWNKGKKGLQRHSDETLMKLRKAHLGRKMSDETRTKLSLIAKAKGWRPSREATEKSRQVFLEYCRRNKNIKLAMSLWFTTNVFLGKTSGFYGRKHSAEARKVGPDTALKAWETKRRRFGENIGSLIVLKAWETRRKNAKR